MSSRMSLSMIAVVAGLGVLCPPAAWAQPAQPAAPQAEMTWHHQMQYRIMKDKTEEMGSMAQQMSRGDLTAEQRKEMGERMERMAR